MTWKNPTGLILLKLFFYYYYYYSYGIHWHGTNRTVYYLLSYTLSI